MGLTYGGVFYMVKYNSVEKGKIRKRSRELPAYAFG